MGRVCKLCGSLKVLNEQNFPKEPLCKDGFRPECRKCYNTNRRQRYNTDDKYREERLAHNRKSQFGLTNEQYKKLCRDQNGLCVICNQRKELCVDHNHLTNEIRGLLCSDCNIGLGMFKESILALSNAVIYLKKDKLRK